MQRGGVSKKWLLDRDNDCNCAGKKVFKNFRSPEFEVGSAQWRCPFFWGER